MTRVPAPRRPPLPPLDRLRLRLAVWYVGTTAAILLALGGALFFAVAHQIGAQLDESLSTAVLELIGAEAAAHADSSAAAVAPPLVTRDAASLRVAGLDLYLLDSAGTSLLTGEVIPAIRTAARHAAQQGIASLELPSRPEHVIRVRAQSFHGATGALLVAAAAADLEDLEDQYTLLIWQFAVAAFVAVLLAAVGGSWLARQSSTPIEATMEHMREFMADAAHELRTPVSILRTEAEVALDRPRGDEMDQRAFAVIAHSSRRLSTVVDDLFTLARADAGDRPIEREPVVLDDLVSDAVLAVSAQAAKKGIALDLAEFEEARVVGSAALLARLIGILLDNAIKYTPAGGSVRVAIRSTPEGAAIQIADTGIGISPAVLPRVYDRFFRADDARAMAGGAGLGLAIARWITDAHGGSMVISSTPGTGTVVTVSVPR
ncbi:MAG: HAMP domain-containing sensor histidine kinase [Gemmatimonadaceae bacterium]